MEKVNSIEFNNVFFSYIKDKELLKDLSFKVTRGDMFCIFGKNGCGKSTILKLLMYLYQPDQGEVKFNGINLKNLSIHGVREKIAIVSQQSKLFDKTVIENICLETDSHEVQKAMEFLNSLGFDSYINKLPEGYDTLIYENGENLSGGQKQLISLARALCKKPDVLLLDEPTSSMDGESEMFVIDTMKNFKKQGIVILVTHKLNPAKESDQIIILNDGVFQGIGTHDELFVNNHLYAKAFSEYEY